VSIRALDRADGTERWRTDRLLSDPALADGHCTAPPVAPSSVCGECPRDPTFALPTLLLWQPSVGSSGPDDGGVRSRPGRNEPKRWIRSGLPPVGIHRVRAETRPDGNERVRRGIRRGRVTDVGGNRAQDHDPSYARSQSSQQSSGSNTGRGRLVTPVDVITNSPIGYCISVSFHSKRSLNRSVRISAP